MYPVPPCPHRNERRSYTNTYLNISGSLRIRYAALRFDVPIHHHLGSLIILMDMYMHMVYVSVFVYIIPPGLLPFASASASKFDVHVQDPCLRRFCWRLFPWCGIAWYVIRISRG